MASGRIREAFRKWFRSRTVRKFAFSSVSMCCARAAWILSAFTVGVAVARRLGPDDFGVVSYAAAYVGMFSVIAALGIDAVVARDYVLKPEAHRRIMGNFFVFKTLSTLLMLFAVAGSLFWIREPQTRCFILLIASGYLFYPLKTVEVAFQSEVKNEYLAYAEILTCFIYSALRLWAVVTCRPLAVFAAAEAVLTGGIASFAFLFYCRKIDNPFHWSFAWKEALSLAVPALPLAVTVILSGIYARTDTLMLHHYAGDAAVGCYTIAAKFTENMAIVFAMLGSIFSVVVIRAYQESREAYRKQLHRFFFMMFYLTLPPIVLSLLFGKWVIRLLYGEAFLPAAGIFSVYVLTLATNSLILAYYRHAVNENRLMTIAAVYGSGVVLNVPLNGLLIPRFGGAGAAAASVVSMAAGLVIVLSCTKKGREELRFILHSLTTLPKLFF